MKVGCLLFIAIFGGAWFGYSEFLKDTSLSPLYWIPIALGFAASAFAISVHALILAFVQKQAAGKLRTVATSE